MCAKRDQFCRDTQRHSLVFTRMYWPTWVLRFAAPLHHSASDERGALAVPNEERANKQYILKLICLKIVCAVDKDNQKFVYSTCTSVMYSTYIRYLFVL
jgi:hypothetical protein